MSSLEQLARLVGIQEVIPNREGGEQPITSETRQVLLTGMGIPAGNEDEAKASLAALEQSSWERALPRVVVLTQQRQPVCPIVFASDTGAVTWTLTLENGECHTTEVDFLGLELAEESEINGTVMQRRHLLLTAPTPNGYHEVRLTGVPDVCRLIVTPGRCWLPEAAGDDRRLWGLATQLYLLRSEKNWGIGDFRDLRALVQLASEQGADIVGVNPLHAMFLDKPEDPSPYSPSDRLLLNVLNINIEDVPELAYSSAARELIASAEFQAALKACRETSLVDYAAVATLKVPVLKLLFAAFNSVDLQNHTSSFKTFHNERLESLDRSCTFQALRLHMSEKNAQGAECSEWPEQYRNYEAPGIQGFREEHADLVRFQLWLQWTADCQLRKAQHAASAMAIGLYRDLAVGSHASGAEAWTRPHLFARGTQIGAPPGQFNPLGQNWGLPPLNPLALKEDAYASFIDLLRANMRYAGALRIDHVMALRRLYWIPSGGKPQDGAYVHYPIEDLVGILALESERKRCLVIGEDLGGVPAGFRERMAEANILSYRVLAFERDDAGFASARDYPLLALSVAGNHDLPTLAGWWSGKDIDLRDKLRLFPNDDGALDARKMREKDRAALVKALLKEGLIASADDLESETFCHAAHKFLARTASILTIVQLDDLAQEPEQVNVPGTSDENPNWRRKLALSVEDLARGQELTELAAIMRRSTNNN